MNLTISGSSTALFSTWYFIEELGLLFDCGDGLSAALLHKSRKIDQVFISHADRDHLTGLLQFNQLNAREHAPVIHYPKDSGSFPALRDFSMKFDPHVRGTVWKPIQDKDRIWIRKDVYVQAIRNNHVACDAHVHKSLGYNVVQVKSKLNEEYVSLSGTEIREAIERLGKAATHTDTETILLSYSGDTPCENFEHWNHSKILIHEATFMAGEDDKQIQAHGNKHSYLEEVIKAVAETRIECLILGHFSSRYSDEQIDRRITELCRAHKISIPVYRMLPGRIVRNILAGEKIYEADEHDGFFK